MSHQWSSLAPDTDGGSRPKCFDNSLVPSKMSARESMMYHADRRNSGSAAAVARDGLAQIVTKQEQRCGHRVEHTDILIGGVQTQARAERSPVSPLISPSFPRPISTVSQKTERPILDCEFSFENTNEALPGECIDENPRSE